MSAEVGFRSRDARRPLIVDIKRGSREDGPGIRSVVFFKGCPLRCVFCHNPETQHAAPEIAFSEERCIHCGSCARLCPQAAIELASPLRVDRTRCDLCGRCEVACSSSALRTVGKYWAVEDLAELLLRDDAFYRHSGGGVTLSGGECTLFPDYLERLARALKASQLHIVLETCGYFDYDVFARKILPYVDLIFFDLKLMDCSESVLHLGQPNKIILENLRALLTEGRVEVRPRVPLIPGVTDAAGNLARIVDYLCEIGASNVSVLPYNPLSLGMYSRLGRPVPNLPASFTQPERETEVINMLRSIIAERCEAQSRS